MARTAQKVQSLIGEDAELADALETVYERSEGGEQEVGWADVKDELTSGQWGRLIETGILVDGEDAFEVADPDAVASALDDTSSTSLSTTSSDDSSDADEEGAGWSTWDKAAGIASILLFLGYSQGPIRNLVGETIDLLLGPLDLILPFYAVIMTLALFTGLYSTLLQANLMDMDKMSQYQGRMKEIQERQKEAKERGDEEELEEIREEQMEAMGDQLGMFKLQFRPMVWIMLLTIPVFLWMYWKILPGGSGSIVGAEPTLVIPLKGEVAGWTAGVVGPLQTWLLWYFLCSMAFTQIIRKSLNIQTTPT